MKYIYGHCTQWDGRHGAKYVSQTRLDHAIADIFNKIRIPDDVYSEVSKQLRGDYEEKVKTRRETIMIFDREITKYQTRIERVYEDHLDDKIPTSLYEKRLLSTASSKTLSKIAGKISNSPNLLITLQFLIC